MDIQVGDRVTYKYWDKFSEEMKEKTIIFCSIDTVFTDGVEILKVERPKYEPIEEKKELLTEKEKKKKRKH